MNKYKVPEYNIGELFHPGFVIAYPGFVIAYPGVSLKGKRVLLTSSQASPSLTPCRDQCCMS